MARIATQISAHMENRPGALAELTEALVDAGINILGVSVPDTGEYGTVRVLPDDVLEARAALEEAGIPHAAVDVLAVDLPHEPGTLARIARVLADENVVVRYAYCTVTAGETGLCVLRVDDIHKAQAVLDKKIK